MVVWAYWKDTGHHVICRFDRDTGIQEVADNFAHYPSYPNIILTFDRDRLYTYKLGENYFNIKTVAAEFRERFSDFYTPTLNDTDFTKKFVKFAESELPRILDLFPEEKS